VTRRKALLPINSGNPIETLRFFKKNAYFQNCFYHPFHIRYGERERLRELDK